MVTEYHLRLVPLGTTDNLEEVVKYIHENYGFISSEKREKILEFWQNTDDKRIQKYKTDLTLNVPYRLQTPFYEDFTNARWNGSKKVLTDAINRQKRLMYYLILCSGLDTVIEIHSNWAEYLCKHKEILNGWTQLKLIHYLQNRNPSVPGIADKLEPPCARDIAKVGKYWKLIVQVDLTIKDIYGDISLVDTAISVDHFVPWQYVAHDELWNLHPTTRNINSSKNNSLPSWDRYFNSLGNLEYRAYELRSKNEAVANEFAEIAKYHLNNQEIRNQLYKDGLTRNVFIERLENVVKPVYESAKILGFKEWVYEDGAGR